MNRGLLTRRLGLLVSALVAMFAGWIGGVAGADVPSLATTSYRVAGTTPFVGSALWINQLPALLSPQQLASQAAQAGARTLFVKAANEATPELQFSAALVGALRAAGESVCAWTFASGQDAPGEAAAAVLAVHDGAQCLVVDAEGEYDSRYGAAQEFVHALRAQLGASFPIALAGQAEVLEHPEFPYSVFLGPGGFQLDMPQVYWRALGVSVEVAMTTALAQNAVYGRPIAPVGQLFEEPAPSEVQRFRALMSSYALPGGSFFDLDSAQPAALVALAAPVGRTRRRTVPLMSVRPGADGDEVLWAQELLNAAGAHLPVGGFFGAQTARALEAFQRRHQLRASGVLDPATWRALLRGHAREPSWTQGPPDSARGKDQANG